MQAVDGEQELEEGIRAAARLKKPLFWREAIHLYRGGPGNSGRL
jgi:hypothetical protein